MTSSASFSRAESASVLPELFARECRKSAAAVARDLILVDADASQ